MKLQQLRYAVEVYKQNLNVSSAAESLFTSQPGISKQIRLLEDELGIDLFIRHGKRIVDVTTPGKAVLSIAENILHDVKKIKSIGHEFVNAKTGSLVIATTHTQARYALPTVVKSFLKQYPSVKLSILPTVPSALDQMVIEGEADFAIGTELIEENPQLKKFSCYTWNRSVIVPEGHELLALTRPLQLQDLIKYPLITYDFAFQEGSQIARAFKLADLPEPDVVLATTDTDIIKTYVAEGIGIGLLASMAYDAEKDLGLELIHAEHLFEPSFSHVVLRQDAYIRGLIFAFLSLFSPALTKERIEASTSLIDKEDFSI